jgi:hypothetical protein
MEDKNKEIELVEIHSEQITDDAENENTAPANLPELQIRYFSYFHIILGNLGNGSDRRFSLYR